MPVPTEEEVRDALTNIIDPEIGINIIELGLVYDVEVKDDGFVRVTMTLTSPGCPLSGYIATAVESNVGEIDGVTKVEPNLVWSPPWNPSMMTEDAKLELGIL